MGVTVVTGPLQETADGRLCLQPAGGWRIGAVDGYELDEKAQTQARDEDTLQFVHILGFHIRSAFVNPIHGVIDTGGVVW